MPDSPIDVSRGRRPINPLLGLLAGLVLGPQVAYAGARLPGKDPPLPEEWALFLAIIGLVTAPPGGLALGLWAAHLQRLSWGSVASPQVSPLNSSFLGMMRVRGRRRGRVRERR